MDAVPSVEFFVLGSILGVFVLTMASSIFFRFRRALVESRAASNETSSGVSLFVTMVMLHPQTWLVLALLGYGGYAFVSQRLNHSAVSFYWGVAVGAPILATLAILGQRRRKMLASAKSTARSHVA